MAQRARRLLILAALILGVAAFFAFYLCTFAKVSVLGAPRITRIGRFEATIAWETNRAVVGEVSYRTAEGADQSSRESQRTSRHSVKIAGLMPETPYTYHVTGLETAYTFKTAPLAETAFRFMVYQQNQAFRRAGSNAFVRAFNYHLPDFALVAGRLAEKSADYLDEEGAFFQNIRCAARTPVFLLPAAGDLGNAEARRQYSANLPGEGNGYDFGFDYGNSRFIVCGPEAAGGAVSYAKDRLAWFTEQVAKDSPAHVFFILTADASAGTAALIANEARRLRETGKIEAVFATGGPVTGSDAKTIAVDGSVLVVDIDGEGVSAGLYTYAGTVLKTVTLHEVPVSVARSCIYCRKLLDTKRYQESIQWYRDFIAKFGEKYMVDDAQYEIANIYDRYLRDYAAAVKEYRALLGRYPESNKALQAGQRLAYLESYADYDFKSLRVFETAKSETFQRDQDKAVGEVASILTQYPGCRLESQILSWLGYTVSQKDLRRSVPYYRRLIDKYPAEREEAWVALGDAYYLHRYYRDSMAAYNTAFKLGNDQLNFALLDKIRKSQRNILRKIVLAVVFVVLLMSLAAAFWLKPRFMTRREVRLLLNLGIFYLFGGGMIWVLFFRGYPELVRYFPVLCLTAAVIPSAGAALSRKVFPRVGKGRDLLFTAATVFFLTGLVCYIMLYYYHYLPAFGL